MLRFPTDIQYQDALQNPRIAFADPLLKAGAIRMHPHGYPYVLAGNFALTYSAEIATGRRLAIRCFRQEAAGRDQRYRQISETLRGLRGPYFVDFEYQARGVLVEGSWFPIVRMDWAEGDTLGAFVRKKKRDGNALLKVRQQFLAMDRFLRDKRVAHGDLQNGNVIIGSELKLVDYDGLYVPSMPEGQGIELGHPNFQHPQRSAADFGPNMDRFSFIVIDIGLRAIAADPSLLDAHGGDDGLLFLRKDLVDPQNSRLFAALSSMPALAADAANLAQLCRAKPSEVPHLDNFLAGVGIPIINLPLARPTPNPVGPAPRPPVSPRLQVPSRPSGKPPSWLPPVGAQQGWGQRPGGPAWPSPGLPSRKRPRLLILCVLAAALLLPRAIPFMKPRVPEAPVTISTPSPATPFRPISTGNAEPPAIDAPAAHSDTPAESSSTAPAATSQQSPTPTEPPAASIAPSAPLVDGSVPSASAAPPPPPPPEADWTESPRAYVASWQQTLTSLGYDVGPVDGVLGQRTRAALAAFAEANGIDPANKDDILQRLSSLAPPPAIRHSPAVSPPPSKVEIDRAYTVRFARDEFYDLELAVLRGLNAGVSSWQTFDLPSGLHVEGRFVADDANSVCKVARLRISGRYTYPEDRIRFCIDLNNVWRQAE